MRSKILSLDGLYHASLSWADWDWNIHVLLSASPLLCQLCLKTAGTDPWQRGFAPALLSAVCLASYLNRVPSSESKHYLASSLLRLRPSGCCPCWLRLAAVWWRDLIDQTNVLTAVITNSSTDVAEYERPQTVRISVRSDLSFCLFVCFCQSAELQSESLMTRRY